MKNTTVVLGGGGVWGVAWMTGLIRGMADSGLDLSEAGAFIGTSAGSVVSAQIASGMSAETLFQRQVNPADQPRQSLPSVEGLGALGELLMQPAEDNVARARQIGAMALKADTVSFARRRAEISERLGLASDSWPAKRLTITAVDAETGDLVPFDASSGVSLIDAVAASCAVPGIWPATPINGRHYIDGGVWRSADNAHLAAGAQRAIIISPVGSMGPSKAILDADIAMLRSRGAKVVLIGPDDASVASGGGNLLDPATRKPAADAGRAQGRRCPDDLYA